MTRRSVAVVVAAVAALGLLTGCGGTHPAAAVPPASVAPASTTPVERATVRIVSLKGPTTMGLVELMDAATHGTARQDYRVTMYGTPDEVVPLVAKGDVDVALIPANLAAVLYNRTLGAGGAQLQVAAVTTLGVLEVVENGDTVRSVADLRGRTVYSTGKGASPQYVLEHVLAGNGVGAGDLTVDYRSEATEVAALVAATPGAIGVLPQPYATVVQKQDPAVRSALQLTQEWRRVSPDSQLVTGVLVVRTAFVQRHPAVVRELLEDYGTSVRFTNEHPQAAATLVAAAGIVPSAALAQAAIPACHVVDLEGGAMRSALEGYLQVLLAADPASVGGRLPGDDFYYRG